jgi:hypothetical protein
VKRDVRALLSLDEVARRVRNNPGRWLLGGAAAGVLAGRFFAVPLAREGRRRVAGAAIARLRPLAIGLATAVASRLAERVRSSRDGQPQGDASDVEHSHLR